MTSKDAIYFIRQHALIGFVKHVIYNGYSGRTKGMLYLFTLIRKWVLDIIAPLWWLGYTCEQFLTYLRNSLSSSERDGERNLFHSCCVGRTKIVNVKVGHRYQSKDEGTTSADADEMGAQIEI